MAIATLTFPAPGPVSLTIGRLTRTDTGGSVGGTVTQVSSLVWTLNVTEPAPGLTYLYSLNGTWSDGSTGTVTGTIAGTGASNQTIVQVVAVPALGTTTYTGSRIVGAASYPLAPDLWQYPIDLVGQGWSQLVWTVKAKPTDADSAALIAVKVSNPAAGSDGLFLLNGAAPVSPVTAADGTLSVGQVAATAGQAAQTMIQLRLTARGTSITPGWYGYEFTAYDAGGGKLALIDGGVLDLGAVLRQSAVAT